MNRKIYTLVLFILLLATFGSPAWGLGQKDINSKFERGQSLFEAGDLHQAATLLEEVITAQPAHQSARRMLFACYRFIGIEYYGQSRCQDAIEAWRKALIIDPKNQEIQRSIERCKSEMRAVAVISGDTNVAVEKAPPAKAAPTAISANKRVAAVSKRSITCGLSFGIVVGTGNSHQLKTGTTFTGCLSLLPDRRRFGVRLDGSYSRFYRNFAGTTSPPRYLSVYGSSASAIIRSKASRSSSVYYCAGLGLYEIILAEPNDGQDSNTIHKSSVLGINFGLGLQKKMGAVVASLDAKYIHLGSSFSPNLLQISIGISSN